MPDGLHDLLEKDREALEFYDSLPMFIQDHIMAREDEIQTIADLSAVANESMREGLFLGPYKPMFEDETESGIDYI